MPNIVQVNVTQTLAPIPATLQQSLAYVSQGGTNTSPGTATLMTGVSSLTAILQGAKSLSSITLSAGTATATATAAHGFTIGDTLPLTIAGATPAGYNGTFLCTVTTTTQFTYALSGSLSTGTGASYTPEDVAELNAMITTHFAQGSQVGCYVLELGPGNANDGVTALTAYLTANPNTNYTPGATGYFYGYVVPRYWDANANFLALIASYENPNSRTYFFVTTTLSTYTSYTALMKDVVTMIESPSLGVYGANALTAIAWSAGQVTATTTTAHGVVPGNWFSIAGNTPSGYNGTFLALPGTTGSTIIYNLAANPGTSSVLGTLQASLYANAAIPASEFSIAAAAYQYVVAKPAAANKVAPFAFRFLFGVTPFPTRGNQSLLTTLKNANINIVLTGAEGGISTAILEWGTTQDGNDATYWYSADWVQINADIAVANAVINGSNNPQAPLYYDQTGINRLQNVVIGVMNSAVAFGLA